MAIVGEKTIGNALIHQINDMAPTYSADTGTIAISSLSGNIFRCVNKYDWVIYLSNVSGDMYSFDNSNDTSYTLNIWVNMNDLTWTSANLSGFTLDGPELTLDFDYVGKFLITSTHTLEASNSLWASMEVAPTLNNLTPTQFIGSSFGTDIAAENTNIICSRILTMDGRSGDYINVGNRMVDQQSSLSRTNRKHHRVTSKLIDTPISFNEDFKTNSFETYGWSLANDSVNKWVIGDATSYSGSNSLYISDDNGVTNAYTNTSAQVSHVYKDFSFPFNMGWTDDTYLDFYWKCSGETGQDYSTVYLAPTSVTPTAGVEINDRYRVSQQELNGSTNYTRATIPIGSYLSLSGETKRLIFSWKNNANSGTNPPMSIDLVRLHFYVNRYRSTSNTFESDFESGSFSGDGWTVVNDSTNIWIVGSAHTNSGVYSSYISDNSSTATYDKTNAEVSHIYRDITFPTADNITLSFEWSCWGENGASSTQNDYGTVVIAATSTTPVAGTEVSTSMASIGGNGRIGAVVNDGKFNEGYGGGDSYWRVESIDLTGWAGLTKRLIFTWSNNTSAGDDVPFSIDKITLDYENF